ncbi:MAG: glycosyltransferase family 39 protein, partial [Anaerolineae bacterium]|nr:glycosyltransferase family 39 protein [Anaerolineae bacterium]
MTWAILLLTVLVGAVARFYKLGDIPPGLYHDEAFNGIDALRVLGGERPVFFEANNGREPLFLYGIALVMSVLGRTPVAVRLTAAVLGTLLVPTTFLMARAMFGERVGLWSAWLIAVAPWAINLSRIGLRAISLPLVLAIAVWLWWAGRRKQGRLRWVWLSLSGVFFGLSLYTYTAARFIVVVAAMYALLHLWMGHARPHRPGEQTRAEIVQSLLVPAFAGVLVAVPFLLYLFTHWDMAITRPGQVSVFNPEINGGDLWGTLIRNVISAVGLFVYRGDFIPRHNVPFRPLFDPLLSVFFVLGVFFCLHKRDDACVLALIWTGVMLLPTILAEDCPHFLRAVGVLPAAAVFPALGLEWVRGRLASRGLVWPGYLGLAAVLLVSAVWGGIDYFVRHGANPELAHDFELAQVQEAIEINRFLGTGWQGEGIA